MSGLGFRQGSSFCNRQVRLIGGFEVTLSDRDDRLVLTICAAWVPAVCYRTLERQAPLTFFYGDLSLFREQ